MLVNLKSRTNYLSLSLFADNVVGALYQYTKDQTIGKPLRDVLNALKVLQEGDMPQDPALPFRSYEQIHALEQAWSQEERAQVLWTISRVLNGIAYPTDVYWLVGMFLRLANHARWGYEKPSTPPPQVIQEMCGLD